MSTDAGRAAKVLTALTDQVMKPLLELSNNPEAKEVAARNFVILITGSDEEFARISRTPAPFEAYALRLLNAYGQVHYSQERMNDIEKYLSVFPFPKRLGLSRGGYLSFVIEAYLHEIYVFKERSLFLCKVIEKSWRKTDRAKLAAERCKSVEEWVNTSLSGLVKIRGAHTHEDERFTDKEIRPVVHIEATLQLMKGLPEPSAERIEYMGALKTLGKHAHRNARKNWIKRVHDNNQACAKLVDACLEAFYPLLVERDGILANPWAK